ncbi:MAG: hypothetical protein MI863_20290 [Desulfobacterales bacterium]|nr:hypothetical protein [Desulfobacterales bacterium]
MTITCKEFHEELLDDPVAALHRYVLIIAGGEGDGESGVKTFKFWDRNEPVKDLTTRTDITKNNCNRITLSKNNETEDRPQIRNNFFNAHYVSMWTDRRPSLLGVRKQCSYFIPTNASFNKNLNPDIMLTSQLSGCTFGVGKPTAAKQQQLIHIQPGNNEGGLSPANKRYHLKQTVRDLLGNHDIYGIFEKENQLGDDRYGNNANYAAVIGVRKDNAWRFYAQVYTRKDFKYCLCSVTEINEFHRGAPNSGDDIGIKSAS